jgi:arylsulfatase
MSTRPNILLLFTDQQRFDTIRALENPIIRTPVLDRLVTEGTTFTRCYTPSPVCGPARCALMTGLPPYVTGCTDNGPMPQDVPSFVEQLSAAGYQAHGIGKMHFMPNYTRLWGFESRDMAEELKETDDDFRKFLDKNGYGYVREQNGVRGDYYYLPQPSQLPIHLHQTHWVADRSIDFLKRRDRTRPFFLMSSFIKPHPPFETPVPWNKLYRTTDVPGPFHAEGEKDILNYWNQVQNRYKYRGAGEDPLLMRTMKAAYYCCISFIDYQIGRILAELGAEIDNTLVIFTTDHGEYLGDYGCVGKRSMHDVSARIPMIARWPGHFAANERCAKPATLLDLFPTFAAAAGSPVEKEMEGRDLVEIANGRAKRPYVFSQFRSGSEGLYMVTDGTWKYVYSAPDQREWLFNVDDGTREIRDYAKDPGQPELGRLRDLLLQRLAGDKTAVEKGAWRKYPRLRVPDHPDDGLLYQDPPFLMPQFSDPKLRDYFEGVTSRLGFVKGDTLVHEFPHQKAD